MKRCNKREHIIEIDGITYDLRFKHVQSILDTAINKKTISNEDKETILKAFDQIAAGQIYSKPQVKFIKKKWSMIESFTNN